MEATAVLFFFFAILFMLIVLRSIRIVNEYERGVLFRQRLLRRRR